jgi:microcystin degradation protein MlrC
MKKKRVGIAGMWQETNTYSPRATTFADFEAFELLEGETMLAHNRGTGSVIGGFLDGLKDEAEPVGLLSAGAWPAAPPDEPTSHLLIDRLESALLHAPDLDGLLINLHGAMVTAGYSDMEEETLRRLRDRYPSVPLMAVLDLHANFSAEACAHCDVVVAYRTYPHVDMGDCGHEAARLMLRALAGERFVTAYGKLGVLTTPLAQGTTTEPMRGLIERAEERAQSARIERVSLLPGFPYSDVARCGFCVLAVSKANDGRDALDVVGQTMADVENCLPQFLLKRPSPADAVAKALSRSEGPVVLADVADNVGGGSPGDGTALLHELVRQRAAGAIVIITDAEVVTEAQNVGLGGRFATFLGGKSDRLHGSPVHAKAVVKHLSDGAYRTSGTWMTGQAFSMGPTAVIELPEGITVLVNSRATPPFHIEQLTANGIEPTKASIIIAKGAVAWRAAYEPIMASAIEVDTPGCCPIDPLRLTRRNSLKDVSPMLTR